MPLILAVEPDRNQANQLAAIARGRLHAELVLEATAERAFAALGERVPDLILTAPLLSPKDEAAIAERLRALESAAAHVQTLTIPVLAAPRSRPRIGGMLSALRRDKQPASEPDGCDPAVFAEQCATYLERALAGRHEAAAARVDLEAAHAPGPTVEAAVDLPQEPTIDNGVGQPFDEYVEYAADEAIVDPVVPYSIEESPAPVEEPVVAVESPIEPVEDAIAAAEAPMVAEALDAVATPSVDEAALVEDQQDETAAMAAPGPFRDEGSAAAQPAIAAASVTADEDMLLEESPLFELVNEAEADRREDNEEDLDRYIELDLSEFLDPSAPQMVHAVASAGDDSSAKPGGTANRFGAPAPLDQKPPEPGGDQREPRKSEAPGEHDEADWLDVVEALRRDVERLDAAPAASPPSSKPFKKLPQSRKGRKGKPVQDEWGFFDPEQCGFAALLAKLEEVTTTEHHNNSQRSSLKAQR
jgi:hypothetical protein